MPTDPERRPHKIVCHHVYPPIPDRHFDYQAYYDNDEPDDDGNMAAGFGPTEAKAVLDLIENYPRPDVFCPERGR